MSYPIVPYENVCGTSASFDCPMMHWSSLKQTLPSTHTFLVFALLYYPIVIWHIAEILSSSIVVLTTWRCQTWIPIPRTRLVLPRTKRRTRQLIMLLFGLWINYLRLKRLDIRCVEHFYRPDEIVLVLVRRPIVAVMVVLCNPNLYFKKNLLNVAKSAWRNETQNAFISFIGYGVERDLELHGSLYYGSKRNW